MPALTLSSKIPGPASTRGPRCHPGLLFVPSGDFALPYTGGNSHSATRRMPRGVFELQMLTMQTAQVCQGSGLLHFSKESDHANAYCQLFVRGLRRRVVGGAAAVRRIRGGIGT